MSHLCLSGNPDCSGCSPCAACFEFVRVRVLPHAMASVGGPFTDPHWAPPFIHAFGKVWGHLVHAEVVPALQQKPTINASQDVNVQGVMATPEDSEEVARAAAQVEPNEQPEQPEIGYVPNEAVLKEAMASMRPNGLGGGPPPSEPKEDSSPEKSVATPAAQGQEGDASQAPSDTAETA